MVGQIACLCIAYGNLGHEGENLIIDFLHYFVLRFCIYAKWLLQCQWSNPEGTMLKKKK